MIRPHLGLTKEEVRQIVLTKLAVVYRDWNLGHAPFWGRTARPGSRRSNGEAFETALVAGLLGGLSEAIEKNNRALMAAFGRKDGATRTPAKVKHHKREGRRDRKRVAR
jgi:hypothetical protein